MTPQDDTGRLGSRLDPRVYDLIVGMVADGNSAQIGKALRSLSRAGKLEPDSLPSPRTIQRLVSAYVPEPVTQVPVEAPMPNDLRAAWDAIAELMQDGDVRWPSRAIQVEMARLVPLAPALAARPLWLLAYAYSGRRASGRASDDLDAWLAFKPWTSEDAYEAYVRAAQNSQMPRPPWFDAIQSPETADQWEEGYLDPILQQRIPWHVFGGEHDEQQG